ncbi:hypothetical protein RF11_03944 [Thelohanellus kitauei]|uniref:Uncharacterized protein n=1 Tax=Thelohanellus kitauei TaxID=669202 RepID=A0A0C2J7U9_THEKT|nr:hypothetical protein RF11_03944 [Thelohanellus kitauei]
MSPLLVVISDLNHVPRYSYNSDSSMMLHIRVAYCRIERLVGIRRDLDEFSKFRKALIKSQKEPIVVYPIKKRTDVRISVRDGSVGYQMFCNSPINGVPHLERIFCEYMSTLE